MNGDLEKVRNIEPKLKALHQLGVSPEELAERFKLEAWAVRLVLGLPPPAPESQPRLGSYGRRI